MDTRNSRLLDLYTDYLLVSFGPTTATGLASLLPDLSHDQVTRFLSQQTLTDKDLWRIVKPHLRQIQSHEAVLILDDSGEEKPYTDASELICTHFDHVTGRYVKGINLMSCLYFSQGVSLPVNFPLIQKTELVMDNMDNMDNMDKKTGKEKWRTRACTRSVPRAKMRLYAR